MLLRCRSKYLYVVLALAGCSESNSSAGDVVELIGRDWSIPPGEHYKCIGIEVDRDMYIGEFRTIGPLGEHHALLTVADKLGGFGGTQLGEYDCEVLTTDPQMIYASGVGTGPLAMPEGVGLKIEAGQFLHLNLHLYNATDETITTRSSIEATLIDPVAPEREARDGVQRHVRDRCARRPNNDDRRWLHVHA